MSQHAIYGTAASLSTTGFGCKWNAFSIDVAQGITGYYGFGDTFMTNYGTIASWSGMAAGFTSGGTTADIPGIGNSWFSGTTGRAGFSQTLSWGSNLTLAGTIILSALNLALSFLGTPTSVYRFVGSGTPTEVWTG